MKLEFKKSDAGTSAMLTLIGENIEEEQRVRLFVNEALDPAQRPYNPGRVTFNVPIPQPLDSGDAAGPAAGSEPDKKPVSEPDNAGNSDKVSPLTRRSIS
jgi:hypothetical protein